VDSTENPSLNRDYVIRIDYNTISKIIRFDGKAKKSNVGEWILIKLDPSIFKVATDIINRLISSIAEDFPGPFRNILGRRGITSDVVNW
jgi:hypothetical protein